MITHNCRGEEIPNEFKQKTFDIVVCSDLFYEASALPSLILTLRQLKFKILLIGYKRRHLMLVFNTQIFFIIYLNVKFSFIYCRPEERFFRELASWCELKVLVFLFCIE